MAGKFRDKEKVSKKKFSRGISPAGVAIYCFKTLS
jgi:hypothetical protein